MATDHADIRVPSECREMIRAGALVAINTSGGKNSQAMTILLSRIVPRDRLAAVHAPLNRVPGHLLAVVTPGESGGPELAPGQAGALAADRR